jgi:hypothetical protein
VWATRGGWPRGQGAQWARRPGQLACRHWAGPSSFIFSLSFVLFYSLYHFKLDSLLNACFTNSLIKQNKNILQHDATIKAPLGFILLGSHIDIKQKNSSLFRKKKSKARKIEGNTGIW